jgi:thiamine-phosphate pyrophosphorylase
MSVDISLYGIVDPQIAHGRSMADMARAAVEGGATLIQFRAKNETTREMVREARAIRSALHGTHVPLIVNDRVDVALAAGADGVHLGADDMKLVDARRLLGPRAIIGATLKQENELPELAAAKIDYACIGGVFPTQHKDSAEVPLGLHGLETLRQAAARALGPLPVGAIAGINPENAAAVIAAGADGIAVIGALFGGEDIETAARALRQAIDPELARRLPAPA